MKTTHRKTVEAHAVRIAAVVMQAAGLCRYNSADKCRRLFPDDEACVDCIEGWLLSKAKREMANRRTDNA